MRDKVIIDWIAADGEDSRGLPPRPPKCVDAYRDGRAEHLRRHHVDASALKVLHTEVYVAKKFRTYALSSSTRDKEDVTLVWS